jgi:23S rRNA pseudouridine2605 synthase
MSEKIQKIIARAGVASRRRAEELITAGQVRVNGKIAKLGDRAELVDEITVAGNLIISDKPESIVLMYHKPEGVICSRADDKDRPLIFEQLPPCPAGRWIYIGRLDINSSGLMLITNDGEIANNLMHPSKHILRTYLVRVIGDLSATNINALLTGIRLEDGMAKFIGIKQRPSAGGKNNWYEVTVAQGRNRIVRRMFESVNCSVSRLVRIKIGELALPRELDLGASRELTKRELKAISA